MLSISLLKAVNAKHRSKFAVLSPRRIDEKVLRRLYETKQSLMTLSCLSEKRLETRQLFHAQLAL
jgi:flagellar biosynthesis/type III secretory pathway chaperone